MYCVFSFWSKKTPVSPYPFPYGYSFTILFKTQFLINKKRCINFSRVLKYYKKSGSHFWVYKQREINLRVLAVDKCEKITKIRRVVRSKFKFQLRGFLWTMH